jgi:hypothetical protein
VHTLLYAALVAVGFVAPADPPKPPPKPTMPAGQPAEQVAALTKHFDDQWTALRKQMSTAKTEDDREKLAVMIPDPTDYAALLLKIAEDHPKDPAAVDALIWITRNVRGKASGLDAPQAKARAILIRDHILSPKIGPFCASLKLATFDLSAVTLLRQVSKQHPDKAVQAQAMYSLACLLQERSRFAESLRKVDKEMLERFKEAYGTEGVEDVRLSDSKSQYREAEGLFDRLVQDKDFAGATIPRGAKQVKIGDLAASELFEIRHLQPGMPAPEITGTDLDGHAMKLSDFRGKVVLLDFWGHW